MLLYQTSQWIEERQRLHRELRGEETEAGHSIRSRLHELEERLHGQVRQWMDAYRPSDIEASYEPPALADPDPGLL